MSNFAQTWARRLPQSEAARRNPLQSAGAGLRQLGPIPLTVEAPMIDLSYTTDSNIKRFQNLLDTSVDATERQVLQRLLAEEKAKAALQASGRAKK